MWTPGERERDNRQSIRSGRGKQEGEDTRGKGEQGDSQMNHRRTCESK